MKCCNRAFFTIILVLFGSADLFAQAPATVSDNGKKQTASPTPPALKGVPATVTRSKKVARRTGDAARPNYRNEDQPKWHADSDVSVDLAKAKFERAREMFESAIALLSNGNASEAVGKLKVADSLEPDRFEISAVLGVAFAMQRKYEDAVAAFQTAIKLNPKDALVRSNLCRALSEAGRRTEAVDECRKAVELVPENTRYRSQLAGVHLLDDRSSEALQVLEAVFARSQNDIVYLGTLGDAYYLNGDYGRAVEVYEQIASKWPDVGLTYLRLAGVYDLLDKGEQALKAARTFAERNPKLLLAQITLGMSLRSFGFFEEAVGPLTTAKTMDPSDPSIYLALSDCHEVLGDRDNALANLKFPYDSLPPDAELAYRYGQALSSYGLKLQAIEPLERANELYPNDPQIMLTLGITLLSDHQFEKGVALVERSLQMRPLPANMSIDLTRAKSAIRAPERFNELEDAVRKNPDDLRSRDELAGAYLMKRRYDDAELQYLEMIKRSRPNYELYNHVGIFYYDRGQFEKAAEMYKKAIELNPHHILYSVLSGTFQKLGRLDEALVAAKKSVEIKSTLLETRISLGDLYLRKAMREDALREFQAAFDLSPSDPRPNFRLAWLYIRMGNKEGAMRHYRFLKGMGPGNLRDLELSLRAHFGPIH